MISVLAAKKPNEEKILISILQMRNLSLGEVKECAPDPIQRKGSGLWLAHGVLPSSQSCLWSEPAPQLPQALSGFSARGE